MRKSLALAAVLLLSVTTNALLAQPSPRSKAAEVRKSKIMADLRPDAPANVRQYYQSMEDTINERIQEVRKQRREALRIRDAKQKAHRISAIDSELKKLLNPEFVSPHTTISLEKGSVGILWEGLRFEKKSGPLVAVASYGPRSNEKYAILYNVDSSAYVTGNYIESNDLWVCTGVEPNAGRVVFMENTANLIALRRIDKSEYLISAMPQPAIAPASTTQPSTQPTTSPAN